MNNRPLIVRLLCLVCCVVMLPLAAFADFSYNFDMRFDMDADKYPEEDHEYLEGVADLLNLVHLQGFMGTHKALGDNMDLRFTMTIDDAEDTATYFHIYGNKTHWRIESDLLGDNIIVLNNQSLMEFGMKANDMLGLPLQYLAVAIVPYTWEDAVEMPKFFIHQMFFEGKKPDVLDPEYVMSVADYISEQYADDYGLTSFVDAVFSESGIDEAVYDFFSEMPSWIEDLMGEGTLAIDRQENGGYSIHTDDYTIFTRTPTEDGYSFVLDLPVTSLEWKVDAEGNITDKNIFFCLTAVDDSGDDALNITVDINNIPEGIPFNGTCTAEISAEGYMFDEERTYKFALNGNGYDLELCQIDAETDETMLRITASLEETENLCNYYSTEWMESNRSLSGESMSASAIDLLSINDTTLAALVDTVKDSFLSRILPILSRIPASSYNALFTMLDETGILDMLAPAETVENKGVRYEEEEEDE